MQATLTKQAQIGGATRRRPRTAGFVPASLVIARRTVLKILRSPQLLIVGLIQGGMFLLCFRYVFGGAIQTGGGLSYVNFLVPGYVATGILFATMSAATGIAEDIQGGLFDRVRSLPIPRLAPAAGQAIGDVLLLAMNLSVMVLVGFAIGFRVHADYGSAALAFGLCLVYGFAFEWVFMSLGLFAGSAQAAQGMSLVVFPLTFVSSAYVPVDTMPGWMRAFADHQPLTVMIDSVRALTEGAAASGLAHSPEHYVAMSLAWAAGILVVFAPIAIRRYWKHS